MGQGDGPPVSMTMTEVEMSILPRTNINYRHYVIKIQYRVDDLYSVVNNGYVLNRDGTWDYEYVPNEGAEEWRANHRFEFTEARRRAAAALPYVEVNGMTALHIWGSGYGDKARPRMARDLQPD